MWLWNYFSHVNLWKMLFLILKSWCWHYRYIFCDLFFMASTWKYTTLDNKISHFEVWKCEIHYIFHMKTWLGYLYCPPNKLIEVEVHSKVWIQLIWHMLRCTLSKYMCIFHIGIGIEAIRLLSTSKNKANLRDLIAAAGLVTLFGQRDFETAWMIVKNNHLQMKIISYQINLAEMKAIVPGIHYPFVLKWFDHKINDLP